MLRAVRGQVPAAQATTPRARPTHATSVLALALTIAGALSIFPHSDAPHAWLLSPATFGLTQHEEEFRMRNLQNLAVVSSLAIGSFASAQNAVEWRVADGGNGHWYAAIENGANIHWIASRDAAVARGGHLATIGSAGENAVVSNLVIALGGNVFLGGYQIDPSASANVGWTWVDGSPWSYTNWNEGEPNDQGSPNESYLEMWGTTWSDTPVAGSLYQTHRYSVEWDADCNNDGIVDYGQILSGQLADANHNNIPDCCEQGSLTEGLVAYYPLDGNPNDASGNGHDGLAFNLTAMADRFGVANAAYHFNGVNGYMTAAGVPIPTNNAFSWSLWIKAEEPGVRGPIIERAQAFGVNLT
ncbi:MAG: hypothetical protein WCI96_12685, partial [Planctomycetota bacterium]